MKVGKERTDSSPSEMQQGTLDKGQQDLNNDKYFVVYHQPLTAGEGTMQFHSEITSSELELNLCVSAINLLKMHRAKSVHEV